MKSSKDQYDNRISPTLAPHLLDDAYYCAKFSNEDFLDAAKVYAHQLDLSRKEKLSAFTALFSKLAPLVADLCAMTPDNGEVKLTNLVISAKNAEQGALQTLEQWGKTKGKIERKTTDAEYKGLAKLLKQYLEAISVSHISVTGRNGGMNVSWDSVTKKLQDREYYQVLEMAGSTAGLLKAKFVLRLIQGQELHKNSLYLREALETWVDILSLPDDNKNTSQMKECVTAIVGISFMLYTPFDQELYQQPVVSSYLSSKTPYNTTLSDLLSLEYAKKGNYKAMEFYYNLSSKTDVLKAKILFYQGVYEEGVSGDIEQAIAYFEDSLNVMPQSNEILLDRAAMIVSSCNRIGDKQKAIKFAQQVQHPIDKELTDLLIGKVEPTEETLNKLFNEIAKASKNPEMQLPYLTWQRALTSIIQQAIESNPLDYLLPGSTLYKKFVGTAIKNSAEHLAILANFQDWKGAYNIIKSVGLQPQSLEKFIPSKGQKFHPSEIVNHYLQTLSEVGDVEWFRKFANTSIVKMIIGEVGVINWDEAFSHYGVIFLKLSNNETENSQKQIAMQKAVIECFDKAYDFSCNVTTEFSLLKIELIIAHAISTKQSALIDKYIDVVMNLDPESREYILKNLNFGVQGFYPSNSKDEILKFLNAVDPAKAHEFFKQSKLVKQQKIQEELSQKINLDVQNKVLHQWNIEKYDISTTEAEFITTIKGKPCYGVINPKLFDTLDNNLKQKFQRDLQKGLCKTAFGKNGIKLWPGKLFELKDDSDNRLYGTDFVLSTDKEAWLMLLDRFGNHADLENYATLPECHWNFISSVQLGGRVEQEI